MRRFLQAGWQTVVGLRTACASVHPRLQGFRVPAIPTTRLRIGPSERRSSVQEPTTPRALP